MKTELEDKIIVRETPNIIVSSIISKRDTGNFYKLNNNKKESLIKSVGRKQIPKDLYIQPLLFRDLVYIKDLLYEIFRIHEVLYKTWNKNCRLIQKTHKDSQNKELVKQLILQYVKDDKNEYIRTLFSYYLNEIEFINDWVNKSIEYLKRNNNNLRKIVITGINILLFEIRILIEFKKILNKNEQILVNKIETELFDPELYTRDSNNKCNNIPFWKFKEFSIPIAHSDMVEIILYQYNYDENAYYNAEVKHKLKVIACIISDTDLSENLRNEIQKKKRKYLLPIKNIDLDLNKIKAAEELIYTFEKLLKLFKIPEKDIFDITSNHVVSAERILDKIIELRRQDLNNEYLELIDDLNIKISTYLS